MTAADLEGDFRVRLMITCMWYGSSVELISESLRVAAIEVTKVRDGSVAVCVGRVDVTQVDAAQRQSAFADACSAMLENLTRGGVDVSFLASTDSTLALWLTFDPSDGSAGVVLTPQIARGWVDLGAEFFISVMPPD